MHALIGRIGCLGVGLLLVTAGGSGFVGVVDATTASAPTTHAASPPAHWEPFSSEVTHDQASDRFETRSGSRVLAGPPDPGSNGMVDASPLSVGATTDGPATFQIDLVEGEVIERLDPETGDTYHKQDRFIVALTISEGEYQPGGPGSPMHRTYRSGGCEVAYSWLSFDGATGISRVAVSVSDVGGCENITLSYAGYELPEGTTGWVPDRADEQELRDSMTRTLQPGDEVTLSVDFVTGIGEFDRVAKLTPPMAEDEISSSLRNTGWSLAVSDSSLVVGTPYSNATGQRSGAVYVYDRTNLAAEPTRLAPVGLGWSAGFGESLAVSGNTLVVGAPDANVTVPYGGAAYVYDLTNLSKEPTQLVPSELDSFGWFGVSVAVAGDTLVVGAQWDNSYTGAAYVYNLTDLSAEPKKITPPGSEFDTEFGRSVAVSGNTLVVGAPWDNAPFPARGAVYVYDLTNLSTEPTQLAPAGLYRSAWFAQSMAASGDTLVIGAPRDNIFTGIVYVYDLTNMSTEPRRIIPPESESNTRDIGWEVAVSNDAVVTGEEISTYDYRLIGLNMYVYDSTDLTAKPTRATFLIDTTDILYSDWSVVVSSNTLVVSVNDANRTVYVYER